MKSNKTGMYNNLVFVTQIGISMALPIIAGVYLGNKVDSLVGTEGIFLLFGILLGVGTSFMSLYKLTIKSNKDIKRK